VCVCNSERERENNDYCADVCRSNYPSRVNCSIEFFGENWIFLLSKKNWVMSFGVLSGG